MATRKPLASIDSIAARIGADTPDRVRSSIRRATLGPTDGIGQDLFEIRLALRKGDPVEAVHQLRDFLERTSRRIEEADRALAPVAAAWPRAA